MKHSTCNIQHSALRAGFTLIEIMLVVIIIGILAAMVVPRLAGRTEQAKTARSEADIASVEQALGLFELDTGKFPAQLDELLTQPAQSKNWRGPYVKGKKLPTDPWGNPYEYKFPGDHSEYDLFSRGPDGAAGGGDDITNWETTTSQ